jgi:hypothetical protein
MFRNLLFVSLILLLTSCSGMGFANTPDQDVGEDPQANFTQWDVPHTNLTMLIPDGWVTDYHQGDIMIASGSKNLFYSPSEQFEGILIHMFLTDAPRSVGLSFDLMKIAEGYIADQPTVLQAPTLVEQDGRQIVTTLHVNEDSKGKLIAYFTGYVLEDQQLTVFLAATPRDTELFYLPILEEMLYSINIRSPQ